MSQVDVVIVNHNGGAWLPLAMTALQSQSFRDFRIVIVDNDSRDGSIEALVSGTIPVTVVRSPRNLGFAAANNLALRNHVTAPWVALLNPDAFPDVDWLAALVRATREHPDYACFGSRMRCHHDATLLDGIGDAYHVSGLYWRDGHGCPAAGKASVAREIFSPCAAAALYRTRDLLDVGGFDEDYFCYGEDVDLGFRLRLAGHRALYVPDAGVAHVGSGLAGQGSDFALYHGHRNLVWNYVKNMPPALFWACLPLHVLMNVVSLVVFATRGRGAMMWKAKVDAVRGLPAIWRKRRAVQSHRRIPVAALWRVLHRGFPRRGCALDST
ncbi:MAG: glycosyltransferase family 2 protein [Burkholderiales bacterium]